MDPSALGFLDKEAPEDDVVGDGLEEMEVSVNLFCLA